MLAFTLAQPVAGNLTVKVVAATDAKATSQGFSVTAALHDTTPTAVALQTPTSTTSAERPEDLVHVMGNQVHIGVPSSLLDQLGPRWHWSASTATATGHASCPATNDSDNPATITVP